MDEDDQATDDDDDGDVEDQYVGSVGIGKDDNDQLSLM